VIRNLIILTGVFCALRCDAQNSLVVNPSFEDIDSCENMNPFGTILYTGNWFTPFTYPLPAGGGSVDLFTECTTEPLLGQPNNGFGYQLPHFGTKYAGLYLIAGSGREYIEGQLIDTLQTGKHYCIKFYYSFAEYSTLFTDGLGVVVTNDSLMRLGANQEFLVIDTPTTAALDSSYITEDTMSWLLFDETFIAQGGEKFFTIGNFKYNEECTMVQFGEDSLSLLSYIYLDDVSITLCDSPDAVIEMPWWENDVTLFPNPSNDLVEIKTNEPIDVVTVFDAVGRVVYTGSDDIISISLLASGVYVVRVEMKNGLVANRRLVVHL
jgi:hypothetical protein